MGEVETEPVWPHLLLALLTTGVLIGVPWLALLGVGESIHLFGGEPTEWEKGRGWLLTAFWVGVGGSAAGLVLAVRLRRSGFAGFFTTFLVAVLLVWLGSRPSTPGPAFDPAGPGVCQEHSGGDSTCPGG
ncbi:hypothetical protein UO65_2611 [Actinokineospora spheciospongiae]|uniref:Uncharacterized protein n=1 Tax=Actinokineospora spheciospongiae TaxID=909613 RepID=W7IZK4_9PSEU|nr:hypothetical protein [Actinokineospora spheciospongiae]EWC62097.1 hypothetical protein UO65_2611 [Actinokineospora spheciospongiae]